MAADMHRNFNWGVKGKVGKPITLRDRIGVQNWI